MNIGILHPGEMGISVAASTLNAGHEVYWVSAGRSADTRRRAESFNLQDCSSLEALSSTCDIIFSVCPPHAAEALAAAVMHSGFRGIYADFNAVSPQTLMRIAGNMTAAGIRFVDGGIIGLPAWQAGTTWLYLAGTAASEVAACFSQGPMETDILGAEVGKASALKMCFAANNKGTVALLATILGAAEQLGVRDALEKQWERHNPGFSLQTQKRIQGIARKAWRFKPEMLEIASTLDAVGMPTGIHLGAAEIYQRLADFKTMEEPDFDAILTALSVRQKD
ncbi:MAG: DUF1932 domain-containing protein [Pseudomonadales bacterium]|nr:DUF1932 domain-containing protein [Pseudomonadales bacterium]